MSSRALVVPSPSGAPLALANLVEQVNELSREAKAQNTWRAYRSDWRAFEAWCVATGLPSLPASPETVAVYVAYLGERKKVASIERALTSISHAHARANHPSPCKTARVAETMKGLRRRLGVAQQGKTPVVAKQLVKMLSAISSTLSGSRDCALLALGFSGAFRRSELVALDVADLVFTENGIEVTIRRSKTDQEGEGRELGIPWGSSPATCPVRAVRGWLEAASIVTGPVFRAVDRHGKVSPERLSDRSVALVVKRYAKAVGLDAKNVAGHSLRSGFATSAAEADKSEDEIMRQTGHTSTKMVRRYVKHASLFTKNAASGLL